MWANFLKSLLKSKISVEIPRLVVFSVKCLTAVTKKSYLRNNPAWNKDDIEVVILFPCLLGHPVQA